MESTGHEGRKILVIDDEAVMQRLFQNILHREGYEVFVASSGIEGLELARQQSPHLIILDWVMPDMDGLETLAQLKCNKATKDIPVLMATGYLDEESSRRFLASGAEACLRKPFEPPELAAMVQRLLHADRGNGVAAGA